MIIYQHHLTRGDLIMGCLQTRLYQSTHLCTSSEPDKQTMKTMSQTDTVVDHGSPNG